MAGWTLWKALPPRYQLTCKDSDIPGDGDLYSGSPRASRKPRAATPRKGSASMRVKSAEVTAKSQRCVIPRKTSAKIPNSRDNDMPEGKNAGAIDPLAQSSEVVTTPRGRATMYFTVTSPRGNPSEYDQRVIAKSSFPSRRSSFINTFKNQQLINSMRGSLEDPSTASPRSEKRSTSAPKFPVTQFTPERESPTRTGKPSHRPGPRAKTAITRREYAKLSKENLDNDSSRKSQRKSAGTERRQNLFVNTVLPIDPSVKPFMRNPLYTDKPPRRYVVRKLDDATMFIDDDKIIFIRKKTTKNDIIQCQKSVEDTHYLAYLRKLYLREPKDMAKFMQNQEMRQKTLIRERLEYDKKTDNILNYYSRIDDRENAFAWAMSLENSNGNNKEVLGGSRSARVHSSPGMRRDNSSKPQSPLTDRPATSRSFRKTDGGSDLHTRPDALSDWNVFVKFNSQSILHDRQFYLQTPMINPESRPGKEEGRDSCECRLCRLEMEMNLKIPHEPQTVDKGGPVVDEPQTVDQGGPVVDNKIKSENDDSNNNTKNDNSILDDSCRGTLEEHAVDEIQATKPDDQETENVDVKAKNCVMVDKVTSTEDDFIGKPAINLTIDLSSPGVDFTEINSNPNAEIENDNTNSSMNNVQEFETNTCEYPHDFQDTNNNNINIVSTDERGKETSKENSVIHPTNTS